MPGLGAPKRHWQRLRDTGMARQWHGVGPSRRGPSQRTRCPLQVATLIELMECHLRALTAPAALEYKLLDSSSNNLSTVADAEANGTVAMNWTAATTSKAIGEGLQAVDLLGNATSGTTVVVCPDGGTKGNIWGTDIDTNDSSICTAAVHVGLITYATGGPVRLMLTPGLSAPPGAPPGYRPYTGSNRNGVLTDSYGAWL